MSIILWLLGKNPDPSTRPRPTAGTCARKETPIPGLRLWSPATCAFDFSSHQRSPPLPHAFPSPPAEVIYLPQLTRTHPLLSTRQRVECTRYGLYIRRKVQARGGDRNGWLWFVFPFQSHIPLYFLSN